MGQTTSCGSIEEKQREIQEAPSYEEVIKWFPNEATHRPMMVISSGTIIVNDQSHAGHDENNPDDGSTSQFALDLAHQMEEFGFETTVSRLE